MENILSVDEKLRKLVHGTRETLGLKLFNHQNKQMIDPDWTDLEEIAPLRDADYLKEITEVANKDEHKYDGDYFVVTVIRREPLLQNRKRKQSFTRKTCPTPTFNQVVWKVRRNDTLQFLWSVPEKMGALALIKNRKKCPPELYPMLTQALAFVDGSLDRECNKQNGEEIGSDRLVKNTPLYTAVGEVWNQK